MLDFVYCLFVHVPAIVEFVTSVTHPATSPVVVLSKRIEQSLRVELPSLAPADQFRRSCPDDGFDMLNEVGASGNVAVRFRTVVDALLGFGGSVVYGSE